MGQGKGDVKQWAAKVNIGCITHELQILSVNKTRIKAILTNAIQKLPMPALIITKNELWCSGQAIKKQNRIVI